MRDFVTLDIETTGSLPWTGDLLAVGVGAKAFRPEAGMTQAGRLLQSDEIVVAHTNYDLRWLCLNGLTLGPDVQYHDTKVMAWMDDSGQELALDDLAKKYLRRTPKKPIRMRKGRVMFDIGLWRGHGEKLIPIEDVPWPTMKAYNEADLQIEAALYVLLRDRLEQRGLWGKFLEREAPLSKLLIEMEVTGLPFDRERAEALLVDTKLNVERLHAHLGEATGAIGFNPGSPPQVASWLYGELWSHPVKFDIPRLNGMSPEEKAAAVATVAPPGVEVTRIGREYAYGVQWLEGRGWKPLRQKDPKTGEMRVTTSSKKLAVAHGEDPWVQGYVEYRKEIKLRGYLESWIEMEHNGVLHGRFDQSGTLSGRLAGREPNLQQVRKDSDVRTLFRGDLVIGDYAQLEARIAAGLSGDPFMLDIFHNERDLYGVLAANAWGGPEDKENPHRDLAKVVWLASQYGARGDTLAQTMAEGGILGYNGAQADALLAEIMAAVPRLFEWREEVIEQAREDGGVMTIGGRPRALPDIRSAAWQLRFSAERQAVSMLVQGSAADVVNAALLAAREAVSPRVARICLQVHDEILWKRGKAFTAATLAKLKKVCEASPYDLGVPLVFEINTAQSWAEKG